MNASSSLMMIGVGTAGCALARGVRQAFGEDIRLLLADTDAGTGRSDGPFVLLGGDRLSGRGTGGNDVNGRMAAEDSLHALDASLQGVRLAVVVTALGGGTGTGATIEIVKHLRSRAIAATVFATEPFKMEGEERARRARGALPLIAENANGAFFIPLDKLVQGEDNLAEALQRAIGTLASGIALFWRLLEKPGYIRLDVERLLHIVEQAGRARFAAIEAQGPGRAAEILDKLARTPLLARSEGPLQSVLLGILAGDDLRLGECAKLADGVQALAGGKVPFTLATVNDEQTFAGRLCAVVFFFELGAGTADGDAQGKTPRRAARRNAKNGSALAVGPQAQGGRFSNIEATFYNNENLDVPTFIRRGISIES
ncbi:MAG TPA: hypothetical protein DD637_04715 [Verrucomicrobia bacterium]|nr:hypothetical protein [Verrucomicrobiota bacterium]HCG20147.1 hypothetical protein [Verrucomicrobiota bacterium]